MGVLWNDRSIPLALNGANAAFSANINLAWDFTGRDAAHMAGVPWIYTGATPPNLTTSGTQTLTTVNGEPGLVPSASSLLDVNTTTNYGMQSGTGDFTIGIRLTTPGTLPAGSNQREIFRLSGASGTAFSISMIENPSVGWYFTPVGSTVLPLGTSQSAVFYPQNCTVMVWITRISNVVSVYTQNVTAQTNAVLRNAGPATAGDLNAAWAARTLLNFASVVTTPAMQSVTHWQPGLSLTTMHLVGKNFYDTQANTAVVDSIAITSPAAGSTIAATSVLSGTYTGSAPTGVEVQFGAGSWVAGTGMTIGSGAWSGSFAFTPGGPSTLQAREANATTVVSATVANITVAADSISFVGDGATTNEAVPYRIFQQNGSNQATVIVKLNYTGSPTGFQYSYDGGAWTALGGTPSGGAHQGSIVITGPSQGPLSTRFTNNPAVVATMSAVGVGDCYMVAGQSNHVGGGGGTYVPPVSPGAHPAWAASILDKTGTWRPNVETSTDQFSKTTNASNYPSATATYAIQASSPNAFNSYFGQLATLLMAAGKPTAFVPSAIGSTSLANWAVTTSTGQLYGAMLARATALGVKNVLWWQGEQDCTNGTTRSAYETALNAMINDWCTRFPGAKWVIMNINVTGNAVGTGGTGPSDTGFNAIHAAIANVAATNPNVRGSADMNGAFTSSIHYGTAPEIIEIAQRAFNAMQVTIPAPTGVVFSQRRRTARKFLRLN